ncbi:MAG: RloB family protein [Nannocystaceae bacterium]
MVVCEGKVTEPTYISGFTRECRTTLVQVEISNRHGVPRALVETAKELMRAAKEQAHREKDDNCLYNEVWCLPDVDDHPKLDEARQMAHDNGIEFVASNPCFELWLLLHFQDNPGMQHRDDLKRMMRKHIAGYDKHFEFRDLAPLYEDAKDRAQRMQRQADEDGEPHRNPTTGVFRLTESIARKNDDSGGGCGGG